jgi:hypothetical protein
MKRRRSVSVGRYIATPSDAPSTSGMRPVFGHKWDQDGKPPPNTVASGVRTPDIRETLENVGIRASAFQSIRLPRGLVGKASYVAALALIGLAIIAWGLKDPALLIAIGCLIVLLFALYFAGVLWFANKHPGVALLEGAELIQWRQLEIAASDVPTIRDASPKEPPTLSESDGER